MSDEVNGIGGLETTAEERAGATFGRMTMICEDRSFVMFVLRLLKDFDRLTSALAAANAARDEAERKVAGISDSVLADVRKHIRGTSDGPETYSEPRHGWTCFHCGETFRTERGAALHFGEQPGQVARCIAAEARLATAEKALGDWLAEEDAWSGELEDDRRCREAREAARAALSGKKEGGS